MALVLAKPNVGEFLSLTKAEEILPRFMTRLKTVSVSSKDVVYVKGPDSLVDVDLLKDVPLKDWRYVGIIGIVASGEWLIPDNVRGGVTISFVDKRLKDSREAILGTFRAAAVQKRFQFKLIPNYFVSQQDALRKPWQVQLTLRGLRFEEGFNPLSLEFVSVVLCAHSIVSKGLRSKLISVGDPEVELSEAVVDKFIDSVPASQALLRARQGKRVSYLPQRGRGRGSRGGRVVRKTEGFTPSDAENFAASDPFFEDALHDNESQPIPVFHDVVGGSHDTFESL